MKSEWSGASKEADEHLSFDPRRLAAACWLCIGWALVSPEFSGETMAEGRRTIRFAGHRRKGTMMGLDDKAKNAAQDLGGKAKEAAGKATDNPDLEAEGNADQAGASLKQAGENVKDAFK